MPRSLAPRSLVLSLVALGAAAAPARADRRAFAHTYEYVTMPQGGLELEFYNTQTRPDLGEDASAFQMQIEVEYGITDRWDVSLYQVIDQGIEEDAQLRYSETKLRTRYRFAERGELPIDPLLYFEVAKSLVGEEVELEGKIILGKDIGPVTLALNLIAELKIEDETEFIPAWAFGVSYEATPAWKLGAETFGELEPEVTETGEEERELKA